MHHVDVHVRNLKDARKLLDAVMPLIGYALRSEFDGFTSYWKDGKRPAIGFIEDRTAGSGGMRLAFAVAEQRNVDEIAQAAAMHGARNVEGPSFHPEYGDDYYAVFFEDLDGNKYEVVRDAEGRESA